MADERAAEGRLVRAAVMVIDGPDEGQRFSLDPGKSLRIGRGLDNDAVLSDKSVSRNHVEFIASEAGLVAQDLGSNNGTMLNGNVIVAPTPLAQHDKIEIGFTVLRVELVREAIPEPTGQKKFTPPVVEPRPVAPAPRARPAPVQVVLTPTEMKALPLPGMPSVTMPAPMAIPTPTPRAPLAPLPPVAARVLTPRSPMPAVPGAPPVWPIAAEPPAAPPAPAPAPAATKRARTDLDALLDPVVAELPPTLAESAPTPMPTAAPALADVPLPTPALPLPAARLLAPPPADDLAWMALDAGDKLDPALKLGRKSGISLTAIAVVLVIFGLAAFVIAKGGMGGEPATNAGASATYGDPDATGSKSGDTTPSTTAAGSDQRSAGSSEAQQRALVLYGKREFAGAARALAGISDQATKEMHRDFSQLQTLLDKATAQASHDIVVAFEALRQAREIDKRYGAAHSRWLDAQAIAHFELLGRSLLTQQRYEDARALADILVVERPKDATTAMLLAALNDKAAALIKQARGTKPAEARALLEHAKALASSGSDAYRAATKALAAL
ncbi:MAG: FHA domain-containing protein [Myxococcales bacterium]|nr:FHA domain-containing protein [Myxococcales bacterium]